MNSFDGVLSRLRGSMAGGFSTIEGSFAGDILQAVACELSRVYSQEIDTLHERAFVQTARGEWLDAACADFGVDRKPGESDDSLRARTLFKVRLQASSGNEAHYKTWALETPGVRAAWAKGRLRGPGTVDVFIVPDEEDVGQALIDAVHEHIESLRPVCVDTAVSYATAVPVDIGATLVLGAGATVQSVAAQFEPVFSSYLEGVALTEQGMVISLPRVAGMLTDCTGVLDANGITLSGRQQSLFLDTGSFAVPGTCLFDLAVAQ